MTNEPKGVLCAGSVVYDILVRPVDDAPWGTTTYVESIDPHVGGNGANTSIALARIGVPVRLIATVGNDDRGGLVRDALLRAGVDTAAVTVVAEATASTVVIVNSAGQRKFLHRLGASELAFQQPVEFTPELVGGATHFHLASFFILPGIRANGAEMLRRARSAGLTTSLDTTWDPLGRWSADLTPCLPNVDFLFLNEDEALRITGSSCPTEGARYALAHGASTAVMKLGERGCAIYTHEREIRCPAYEVDVKDTTGAGDCFAAGLLAAIQRGASLEEAGRFANAVAAMSVREVGATAGVPSYSHVEDWISTRVPKQS